LAHLTASQRFVISLLADGPLTEEEIAAKKVRRDVLHRLQDQGLVKFQPKAKPKGGWKLLAGGRRLIAEVSEAA